MNNLLKELCQEIGIESLGDLSRFIKEEKKADETAVNCLMRYYLELGGTEFKIVA